jgi:hypothetical protein
MRTDRCPASLILSECLVAGPPASASQGCRVCGAILHAAIRESGACEEALQFASQVAESSVGHALRPIPGKIQLRKNLMKL